MKKKMLAATMAIVLLGAGTAFAGSHHRQMAGGRYGMGPGGGYGPGMMRQAPDNDWLAQAPKNVQDAFKQMDIHHSEMRLEIAKGNVDSQKLVSLHNDMIKARRTVADYHFEHILKNPGQRGGNVGWHHHRLGGMMGGGYRGGLYAELQNELSKANPDAARARQIYADAITLSEKHAKERFELMLRYPESMGSMRRCPGF